MPRKNIKRPRLNSRKKRKNRFRADQERQAQEMVDGIKESIRQHEGTATFEEALTQGLLAQGEGDIQA